MFKAIAGAALAASLVVAPLVATGASAATLIGAVGVLEPATSTENSVEYWETRFAEHQADCYKVEGANSSSHGTVTDGGKTITLKPYQDSWPGDHWEALIIKAGNTNNVIQHPTAGVAYASPENGGGQQATVSHWIVCKGTTPATPTVVTPTLTFSVPSCLAAGELIKGLGVEWTSVLNANGSTTWTAKPLAGTVFAEGVQTQWTVPSLERLTTAVEACRPDQPPADETSVLSFKNDCATTIVITTTTTTTIPYVWDGKSWVAGESFDTVTTAERPMTAAEKRDCPLPDTKVEYDSWVDGEWKCGDTQVTQTREVTTTVYEYDEQATPTVKSSVAIETQTRDLTQAEIAECPMLPGSILSSCVGDVPYLAYGVTLPEGYIADNATPVTITFVNPDGEDFVIANQPLSGSILWPGASAVEPKMWPGWALVDGEYVPTDGNFAWTRAGVTVRFDVNPSYETVIEYPQATALCASPLLADPEDPTDPTDPTDPSDPTDPVTGVPAGEESGALAVTGSSVPVWAIGGGAAALLAGIALTVFGVTRRRGVHTS
ncbi:hypothetical protein [Microbacterium sp. CFBP9034]|uniref:hypothetical protein n=1 Tax=Microbacterium sp. CFBP9034 TaxID=3096540 RepID=UPI002A699463|nr:hypothetical protein [Microbacterium sp. CFBP9034]MDY0910335.1 hypothetical protein [Microbacterium sp. CFBP9034]